MYDYSGENEVYHRVAFSLACLPCMQVFDSIRWKQAQKVKQHNKV